LQVATNPGPAPSVTVPPTLPALPTTTVPTTVASPVIAPTATTAPTTTVVADACASPHLAEFAASAPGGHADSLAVGSDGNLWFSDWEGGTISRFSPSGHVASAFTLPAGDHAMDLISGPDGNLWFTDPHTGAIGRMTLAGHVTEFLTPTRTSNPMGVTGETSSPLSITTGPDGALWFTEGMADQIGRVTTAGAFSEYPLPSRDTMHANPEGIATGPDGAIWFTQPLRGNLGRLDPKTHVITEVPGVGGGGQVGGQSMRLGPDGRLWIDDVQAAAAFTTKGVGTFYVSPNANAWMNVVVPGGPGGDAWALDQRGGQVDRITPGGNVSVVPLTAPASSGMSGAIGGMVVGPDGALWFTEGSAGRVGRITCAAG
jgi:streptogramin lyase